MHDSELLRRIADTVAIMLYEMEYHPDGSFDCLEFIGLETLIGPVPDGVSPEDAYDAAVHPDDREAYEPAERVRRAGRVRGAGAPRRRSRASARRVRRPHALGARPDAPRGVD